MPEPHPGGSRSALTFPVQRPGQMRVVPLVAAGAVLEGARPGRQQGRRGEPQSCKDKRAAVTARPARAAPGTGGTGPAAAYRERRAGRAAASSVPGRAGPARWDSGGERAESSGESSAESGAVCGAESSAESAAAPAGRGEGSAAGQAGEGRGGTRTARWAARPTPAWSRVGPGPCPRAGVAEAGVPSGVRGAASSPEEHHPPHSENAFLFKCFSPCFSCTQCFAAVSPGYHSKRLGLSDVLPVRCLYTTARCPNASAEDKGAPTPQS